MKYFSELIKYIFDLICMMPPINELQLLLEVPEDLPILICYGSIALLFFTILVKVIKEITKLNLILIILFVGCITYLTFGFLDFSTVKAAFIVPYPAMMFSLRVIEGVSLGCIIEKKGKIWHLIVFIFISIGLYIALTKMPGYYISIIKTVWSILGVISASVFCVKLFARNKYKIFKNSILIYITIFLIFSSTIIYINTSPIDQILYQWIILIGILFGFIVQKKFKNKDITKDAF